MNRLVLSTFCVFASACYQQASPRVCELDGSNADGRTDLNPITERDVGVASSSDTSPSEFPHDVSSSVADLLKPDDFGYIDAGIAPIKAADGGSDWAYARMDVPNGALVDAPDAPAGTSDSINGSTTVVDVAEPDNLNSQPVDALIAPNTTGDGGSDLADAATDALKGSQTYLFDASAETSHPVDAGIFPAGRTRASLLRRVRSLTTRERKPYGTGYQLSNLWTVRSS